VKRSKRYTGVAQLVLPNVAYSIDEAVSRLKAVGDGQVRRDCEAAFVLGIKATQTNVRGTCNLPMGRGRPWRVLAFAKVRASWTPRKPAPITSARGPREEDPGRLFEFDKVVATPDMMPVVGKSVRSSSTGTNASPKTGTVTKDIGQMIGELKKGMVEFRTDRQGVVHTVFGRPRSTRRR